MQPFFINKNEIHMKSILAALAFVLIIACSDTDKNNDELISVYKEILIIRESESDTSIANSKVREAIQDHDMTMEQFKAEFFALAKDDDEFVKVLDSLRRSFNADIKILKDSIRKSEREAKADSAADPKK